MTHHVLTEAAGETQANGNILEVRDLKKYFLIKKEWKLKKIASRCRRSRGTRPARRNRRSSRGGSYLSRE